MTCTQPLAEEVHIVRPDGARVCIWRDEEPMRDNDIWRDARPGMDPRTLVAAALSAVLVLLTLYVVALATGGN